MTITGTITSTGRRFGNPGQVIWTMSPTEARDIADFFVLNTTSTDLAHNDARLLFEMADKAEGAE